ncbi:hypothetical protein AB0M47_12125 [Hamadaea sp. NPDC051192]|uniref:hypothetical protein n=1 Tax=Hamadaea sp. NPDC051192 TaxID=3154940 RepID=UPI003419E851
MRIRRALIAALLGCLPMMAAGVPADAALAKTDLAVKVTSQGRAAVGKTATILYEIHNLGTQPTMSATVWFEVQAPGGTVFDASTERGWSGYKCTWLTPHKRVRCRNDAMIYPDNDNPSGVYGFSKKLLYFEVKAKCTTPGRFTISYGNDTKPSNNSATLRVTVDGVSAAACAAKPSTSPKASPQAAAEFGSSGERLAVARAVIVS